MSVRMLLIRHGESTWNAVGRWQGQADPPLTEHGESQAQRAAATAARLGPFDSVITSDLRRARRTGEILAEALGVRLAPAVGALAERHAGEWEGLTRIEIEQEYPGYLAEGRRPPGYEPDGDIVERAMVAMARLRELHLGETLLVVSHGGVINALERQDGESWERLDNLEGRWFEQRADGLHPIGARVHLIDDGLDSPDVVVDPGYA
ncbi:MAG: histidine phosphatase family protein [Ilumatobacter sp.]|jgi:broad specificity phosphatase PhoE|uniref:histidine phosphatase family protein n=1 Tax=Ilumatobacter sp. TaxID=1967498 RepID=UPI00391B4A9F